MPAPAMSDAILQFKKSLITHPILARVLDRLEFELANIGNDHFILIFGPTGVGKTTLQRRLIEKRLEKMADSEKEVGSIPFVRVEASTAEGTAFSWPNFYKRCLNELNEPFIADKRSFRSEDGLSWRKKKQARERILQESVLDAIKQRHTEVIFIDEAQALGKAGSGRTLQDQMDCIKGFVNLSIAICVMSGTYQVLSLRNLSGQLSRRCTEIHFPRYKKTDEDLEDFQQVLNTFEQKMPIQPEDHLINNTEFFYYRSVGCVGILKELLDRALSIAYRKKSGQVKMKIFEEAALPMDKLVVIAKETVYWETLYYTMPSIDDLKEILNPTKPQDDRSPQSPPTRGSQPGVRNPKRDKIGGPEHV